MKLSREEVNYIILCFYDIRRMILDVEMYLTTYHELSKAIDMLNEIEIFLVEKRDAKSGRRLRKGSKIVRSSVKKRNEP